MLIDLGDKGLVIIEVKHRSGNDKKLDSYAGWSRCINAPFVNWSADAVKATGLYELARNWCILNGLAGSREATLVNLGRVALFQDNLGEVLGQFKDALGVSSQRQFKTVSWDEWLAPFINDSPEWLQEFVNRWEVRRDIGKGAEE